MEFRTEGDEGLGIGEACLEFSNVLGIVCTFGFKNTDFSEVG